MPGPQSHAFGHRPADNQTRIQVDHHRQVQPALIGPLIGYIADSLLVRHRSVEVLANTVGATGKPCFDFVVALNFFATLARTPCRGFSGAAFWRPLEHLVRRN